MRSSLSSQPNVSASLLSVAVRYRHPLAAVNHRARQGAVVRAAEACYDQKPPPASAVGSSVRDVRLARVEAALFVAKEPLSSRRLGQIASLADGTEARTLIRRLNSYYDCEGCAFRVEEVAGGFRLLTRPQFGSWLRQVHATQHELRLSPPALETLAIVAYRQPVLRAAVEAIRGVQCGEMLRQLMERDLVRIVGRSQELGRPYLFGTTKRFLQIFGLRHIDELPRAQQLRAAALAGIEANASTPASPTNAGLFSTAVRQEESDVKTTVEAELQTLTDSLGGAGVLTPPSRLGKALPSSYVRAEDDDDDFDDEDEDEDEDEDDEDDDLEDGDWEEVDDDEDEDEDEEEDDLDDEDDEEWEDEEEDDDDWDDDEDEDDDDEDEDEDEDDDE